ncbi:hypothetical protein CY34DRAFT_807768 [Suillus luteus UH-Slu-Lm8-n1]|uniref:DUF6533 domain-containing protein n=1 Tax=Suillus luteus UH-Slu-Lm8-n1 TaxID=930992 RepID=A0A0D0AZX7_9AGAM|nr:hypothetical protein CY34DRAFT_807768 [Suillus luteus UH-Slu-Lm8-n1]
MSEPTHLQFPWARVTSKDLALISFTLVVYDHAITFAEEIDFFWSGPWSASRILYLSIRYLAVTQVFLVFLADIKSGSSPVADWLFVLNYLLAFVVMVLCQCVVTLRVWHLFHRSRVIRWFAAAVFISSMIGTTIVGGLSFNDVKAAYEVSSSSAKSSSGHPEIFTIYLPSLIVHTVMFSLTMHRFRSSSRALQEHGIFHRILKEGMFMYAFAAGTLLYEIISLSMNSRKNVADYYPALGGGLAVGTTVVSVCRAMLSIRSLAATYHVDPAWILNHAELSRVQWRRGASEGEIYVEVDELDGLPQSH